MKGPYEVENRRQLAAWEAEGRATPASAFCPEGCIEHFQIWTSAGPNADEVIDRAWHPWKYADRPGWPTRRPMDAWLFPRWTAVERFVAEVPRRLQGAWAALRGAEVLGHG